MDISKITGPAPATAVDPSAAKNTGKPATDTSVSNGAAKQTGVNLSPLSEKLKVLAGEYATNSSFDSEKVTALKAAIGAGTFKVNAEVIADKMIAEAGELTGKKT